MPMTHLWEAYLRRQYARFTPRVRLLKAFPENERGTHDLVFTDAAAMNDALDKRALEHINAEIHGKHGRAHDPNSIKAHPTQMALPRRLLAA